GVRWPGPAARIERSYRDIARPPLAQERLPTQPDGRVKVSFKAAWKDDTHAVPLDPLDFISRLCPPHPDASLPHAARPRRARGTHHHRAARGVPGREPPRPDAQL